MNRFATSFATSKARGRRRIDALMNHLPIDEALPEILACVRRSRTLVLVAEPGAGKTTRVPPALVASGLLSQAHPTLVLLQPRRVAARSVASRIADERGWTLGGEVGYQVRFERKIGPRTRLQVVTEGILTRRLVVDPFLEGVGAVVLDEFHERSLHTDLALALLCESRDALRDDLILVVMSATLDAEPVAEFLGGAPIVRVPGRNFPVEVRYQGPSSEPLPARVATALANVIDLQPFEPGRSDILVFLPGVEEIRRSARALEGLASENNLAILPLHGSLSSDEQDQALRPNSRRKVVLATNIAETSLTIEGVATVVDSGLARVASYDPSKGLDRLELRKISKASATQRTGRAGRTRPGVCLRLWPERETRGLPDHETPEIQRLDLAATALTLHAWGQSDLLRFGWFEAPEAGRLEAAETLLARLGALQHPGGTITELGRRLLEVPAHPRLARLLTAAADEGVLREGATLAALLSEKDLLSRDRPEAGRGDSDLLVRLDLFEQVERDRFAPSWRDRGVDPSAARRVAQARDDFLKITRRWNVDTRRSDEETLLKLVLVAYPDRVVRRRGDGPTGVMVGGRGVRLDRASVVAQGELFLALDPREERRGATLEAKVRVASLVKAEWLEELFPGSVRRVKSVVFDEDRRSVVGVVSTRFFDLTLQEERHASVDPIEAAQVLAEAVRPRVLELVDEAGTAWLARYDLAQKVMPECSWPAFDDLVWLEILETAAQGKRTEADFRSTPWTTLFRGRLSHSEARIFEEQVPESLVVPSGNRVRLTYESGRPPVLAARLQELFGWTQTPRIAANRVPVLLHLLGPNYRPVQITEDLNSFWKSTYFQVRKDLRNRYPKHAWPEDPLTAKAESRGSRRPANGPT